jgi:hypothetical protein
MKKWKDVLCPRVIHCASKKEYIFPVHFWGFFLFFLSFSIFLKGLKKNKRILRYKGGTSVARILVRSASNTLIIRGRRRVQEKDTRENCSMGQGVKTQRQSVARLAYKACFKGSIKSNMELALSQIRRDENVINKTQ